MRRLFAPFASLALAVCPAAAAAPAPAGTVITVAWRDKAPYQYVENGVEKGVLLARARKVFAQAGIPTRFERAPTKRIWASFRSGVPAYCSFGWYHLPEREAWAQYSVVFHQDPPHTVLFAPSEGKAAGAHASLASLLADKGLSLGVVDGASYGTELDALLAASANQIVRRTVEPATMMRMVAAGRVSFMLLDRDDWTYFRAQDASLRHVLQRDFPDMPAGVARYIVCSKDVAPELMTRINKVLETTMAKPLSTPAKNAKKKAGGLP